MKSNAVDARFRGEGAQTGAGGAYEPLGLSEGVVGIEATYPAAASLTLCASLRACSHFCFCFSTLAFLKASICDSRSFFFFTTSSFVVVSVASASTSSKRA